MIVPIYAKVSINDYNREGLSIDVDLSLPERRVIQSLERLIEWRGKPKTIRCDSVCQDLQN
jgi:putative transposase